MLYVTTRNNHNVYTSRHPLCKDRDAEGGLFIPFQNIRFEVEDISELKHKSFGQCVAEILNHFYSLKLTGWDVELAVGRHPFRLVPMSHKILVAQITNNPGNSFAWIVSRLRDLIVPPGDLPEEHSQWTIISVRVAVLFGLFSELLRLDLVGQNRSMDISVAVDDFSSPISVLYAKEMGLPIGNIIYGCNENSAAWDLLHHGEMHTNGTVVNTDTPLCDYVVPASLERLIYARLGREEANRFAEIVSKKRLYSIPEEIVPVLNSGFFGAVISRKRMENVVRNIYNTNNHLLDSYSALAYGALQDYRATNNEAGPALILAEYEPQSDTEALGKARK